MALPRPLLLTLIAAALALVAFYATGAARQSATERDKPREPAAERGPALRSAAPAPARAAPPARVERALARRQTVVLFFYEPGAADDEATARAVAALRGRSRVSVFSTPISRLGDYQALIGGAGVAQAPAVVILRRDRSPRLIEGFVDRESLAQDVADTR